MGLKLDGLNEINLEYNGILDDLGIANNLKLAFSNTRLTQNYDDFAYLLYRQADSAEKYFYFKNDGSIDSDSILSWLGNGIGKVKYQGNQGNVNYPAYQNDPDKMPIIANGGVFNSAGNLFDGTNDFLQVDDYSDIQITSQPFSFYCNFNKIGSSGVIFAKELNVSSIQIELYVNGGNGNIFATMEGSYRHSVIPFSAGVNKTIYEWANNDVTFQDNAQIGTGTYSGALTNRDYFRIGCGYEDTTEDYFHNMNLKTLMIFNSGEYDNYDNFVNAGL